MKFIVCILLTSLRCSYFLPFLCLGTLMEDFEWFTYRDPARWRRLRLVVVQIIIVYELSVSSGSGPILSFTL